MATSKTDNHGGAKPETQVQEAPRLRARAQRVLGETTGNLCLYAAKHLDVLGPEVAPGRYRIRCLWAHEHAAHCKQRDGLFDDSTMLYLAGVELSDAERAAQGEHMPPDGGVFCMHEHSGGEHKGVPMNAEVLLSYARLCGAPLPDRAPVTVNDVKADETAPLLGADLPPQERCDIDPEEATFTFDAEADINSGALSSKDLHELGLFPPGEAHFRTPAKASSVMDVTSRFDELTNCVSAQLGMPKEAILASAATLAKAQGFSIPTPPTPPDLARKPLSFGAFAAAHTPQHRHLDRGYAIVMDALENARNSQQALVLAPPRTGRSLLASVLFPAWLALYQHAKRILVVCRNSELAQAWHREILHMFPAVEPFVGLTLGKNVAADACIHFVGARVTLTGKGYDAVILDRSYPWEDPQLLSYYTNTLLARLKPTGFAVTITNREGADDFAVSMMRSGVPTTTLPADLFPRIVPSDADRTTDIFFWHYNQGLPNKDPETLRWFSEFLSECCTADSDGAVPTSLLKGVFDLWYKDKYAASPPLMQFWKELTRHGYAAGTDGVHRLRRGLRLIPDTYAYREYQNAEAAALASVDAATGPITYTVTSEEEDSVDVGDLTLPLAQIVVYGDEVSITARLFNDTMRGVNWWDGVPALTRKLMEGRPVFVRHDVLEDADITHIQVTQINVPLAVPSANTREGAVYEWKITGRRYQAGKR